MTLEQLYFVSQIAAALSIIASLVFVGFQVRQSEKTQRALMHQAMSERQVDLNKQILEYPEFFHNMAQLAMDWSHADRMRAIGYLRMQIAHVLELHWQHQYGTIDAAALENEISPIRHFMALPGFRVAWELLRFAHTPEQCSVFEKLIVTDLPIRVHSEQERNEAWRETAARIARELEN